MKKALITGITGQDGSYLAEHLLSLGYQVDGLVRPSTNIKPGNISHINGINLVEGELLDTSSVYSIIEQGNYNEIYNLAAQSHVGTSFRQPEYTFKVNVIGPLNLLEAIRRFSSTSLFYQASTSEMFGAEYTVLEDGRKVQNEQTVFDPRSPYAVAKLAAHNLVKNYRESYGIHASSGILFNHESERRGENFVTRKITKWIGEFCRWRRQFDMVFFNDVDERMEAPTDGGAYRETNFWFPKLRLGNIDACRDWGHAKDYVKAMHLMLQAKEPSDYIISTGKTCSVKDFLQLAFKEIGILDYENYFVIDPQFYRPSDVEYLCGYSNKAKLELGWEPQISFEELVSRMVYRDIHEEEITQEEKEETLH